MRQPSVPRVSLLSQASTLPPPSRANTAASIAVVIVLPTPPLPLATAIVRHPAHCRDTSAVVLGPPPLRRGRPDADAEPCRAPRATRSGRVVLAVGVVRKVGRVGWLRGRHRWSVDRARPRSLFPHLLSTLRLPACRRPAPRDGAGGVGGDGAEGAVGADQEVVVAAVAGGDEFDGDAGAAGFVGGAADDRLPDVFVVGRGRWVRRRPSRVTNVAVGSGDGGERARVVSEAHHELLSSGCQRSSQPSRLGVGGWTVRASSCRVRRVR